MGGELYLRGWPPSAERPEAGWWSRLLAVQNLFLAADFKRENRYDPSAPEPAWSVNVILGVIYGASFGETAQRTVRYEINYYNGLNPHGQFRQYELSYWGLAFVIDF